jgi:hypothetical protein
METGLTKKARCATREPESRPAQINAPVTALASFLSMPGLDTITHGALCWILHENESGKPFRRAQRHHIPKLHHKAMSLCAS